ncbi:hypothetical protein FCOIX_3915 [Fusarium coicis]|nr:hypothetical protein FCOIX_3915 [Fusarium coicis]
MSSRSTAIISHGEIDANALETYGKTGHVLLRIGNGGAGATGLIKELAQDYLESRRNRGLIEWMCNHSRNTQLALLNGFIDFALTYERDQEALAQAEGWSYTAGCVFHDHFCLAGPLSDPAGLASAESLPDAFEKIVASGSLFHSRVDHSATMWKEREICILSPPEALKGADAAGAYFLTDRSTVLRQTGLGTISNSTIFFEPTHSKDVLMNSCYASFSPDMVEADTPAARHVRGFFLYLVSPRGQAVIRDYGIAQTGLPLFAPVEDGVALTRLRGGRPIGGKWVKDTELIKARL